jgi:hypothetical protein
VRIGAKLGMGVRTEAGIEMRIEIGIRAEVRM